MKLITKHRVPTLYKWLKPFVFIAFVTPFLFSFSYEHTNLSDDEQIALIDSEEITISDFKNFLKDILQSCGRIDTLTELSANSYLDSLINQTLILLEAKANGLNNIPSFIEKVKRQKESLLISHLIEVKVIDPIITKERLKKFYEEYGGEIRFKQIVIRDEVGSPSPKIFADSVYKLIVNGMDFTEAVKKYSQDPSSSAKNGEAGFKKWGHFLDQKLREVAFKLKAGEVSKPVKTYLGYYIIQIISKTKCGFEEEYRDLKYQMASIYAEKIKNARARYLNELMKKYNVRLIDYNIERIVKNVDKPFAPFAKIPDSLFNVPLLLYDKDLSITLNDLVTEVGGNRITDYRWDEKNFEKWLNFIATNRVTLSEAKKMNLTVKKDINRYKNQLLFEMIFKNKFGEIPLNEEDMREYYKSHKELFTYPDRIRAKQIVVGDIQTAKEIIKLVQNGEDFNVLIDKYSIDPLIGMSGGDLGYFSRSEMPLFHDHCSGLKIGGTSEPIMVPEGYAILQLIEKDDSRTKTFDEAKKEIKNTLLAQKKKDTYSSWIKELQNKFNVSINYLVYRKFITEPLGNNINTTLQDSDKTYAETGN